MTRFDKGADFKTARTGFDAKTMVNADATGFAGAAFDGRHVYFVPRSTDVTTGVVLRHDIDGDFVNASSWSNVDITIATKNPEAKKFQGAVFDGKYVYFVPRENGLMTRLHARTPAAIPDLPQHHGSFL